MITNIIEYLIKSAKKFPDKFAFCFKDTGITYKELDENSKKIACNFVENKTKPIAIFIDKSIECVEAMYGVIRSGNFYTIIDTKMPIDRINLIFETLSPIGVITTEELLEKAKTIGHDNVLTIEELLNCTINEQKIAEVSRNACDTDPVYSLFTSGSTGVPKGYIVNHKGVIDFCEAMTDTFNFDENTVFGNQSPLYFDLSIADMFCGVKNGSTVHLMPQKIFMFPVKTIEYLNEYKIDTIFWVPSALVLASQALEVITPKYVEKVLFCGEVMPIKQLNIWRKYLPNVLYANLYGPAETVDASTYYIINRDFQDNEMLPIGIPFKNTKILVLDENNQEVVDKNVVGELYIGGSSLSMGYFNNPEKTKEAYIQNPLNKNYLEMLYKTGDLVKYNEQGELVYVSRKDYQIKHMGYRIELGEVEAAVSIIDDITEKACIYDDEKDQIVMFYLGKEMTDKEIVDQLKNKLPAYMIPNVIIHLDLFPHNANGKVNKKELKENYIKEI